MYAKPAAEIAIAAFVFELRAEEREGWERLGMYAGLRAATKTAMLEFAR